MKIAFVAVLLSLFVALATCRGNVYIIYTGGTIGMKQGAHGWEPKSGYIQEVMNSMPAFHAPDIPYYTIKEIPPIDSSNMYPSDWVKIANEIADRYYQYDGFVVLHGTDTMSFTSSALSFLLQNVNKTVVVTGSQIPLCETFTDATNNLLGALRIAGNYYIPEVTMFFDNTLFRGNRVQKVSANSMHGFDSANYPALGTIGLDVYLRHELIRKPPTKPFSVLRNVDPNVTILHLYPGISGKLVKTILESNVSGVVLLAFGAGNGPDRDEVFISSIRDAVKRGIPIIDVSQCHQSRVDLDEYGAAFEFKNAGVISGLDLTPEAAFTKLAAVLGNKSLSFDEVKTLLQTDIAGEMTPKLD